LRKGDVCAAPGGTSGHGPASGTIAGVFPSPTPRDSESWDDDVTGKIARSKQGRKDGSFYAGDRLEEKKKAAAKKDKSKPESEAEEELDEEIHIAPVRRALSVAIAGFAGLLGAALVVGALTSGPDARWSFGVVIFGVQLLYVLAFTMALQPPAAMLVAGLSLATAAVADIVAVTSASPGLMSLVWVLLGGFAACLVAQAIRAVDRRQLRDALGGTFVIPAGVASLAALIVLTRMPIGTQAVLVCFGAATIALVVAHLVDAVWPKPRIALQVSRGATGIVVGAMAGTLAAAAFGSLLVYPFTPGKGAVLGLVAGALATLIDLAVNYSEAGRGIAGTKPTLWVARHMQGPLGAFALSFPGIYALTVFYLS
jgi:hypothetical protein